jgi:hypothetical protein
MMEEFWQAARGTVWSGRRSQRLAAQGLRTTRMRKHASIPLSDMAMESAPQSSPGELLSACSRLRRALAHVQCAVLDLHEAFLQRDCAERDLLERQTNAVLQRAKSGSKARGRA